MTVSLVGTSSGKEVLMALMLDPWMLKKMKRSSRISSVATLDVAVSERVD